MLSTEHKATTRTRDITRQQENNTIKIMPSAYHSDRLGWVGGSFAEGDTTQYWDASRQEWRTVTIKKIATQGIKAGEEPDIMIMFGDGTSVHSWRMDEGKTRWTIPGRLARMDPRTATANETFSLRDGVAEAPALRRFEGPQCLRTPSAQCARPVGARCGCLLHDTTGPALGTADERCGWANAGLSARAGRADQALWARRRAIGVDETMAAEMAAKQKWQQRAAVAKQLRRSANQSTAARAFWFGGISLVCSIVYSLVLGLVCGAGRLLRVALLPAKSLAGLALWLVYRASWLVWKLMWEVLALVASLVWPGELPTGPHWDRLAMASRNHRMAEKAEEFLFGTTPPSYSRAAASQARADEAEAFLLGQAASRASYAANREFLHGNFE